MGYSKARAGSVESVGGSLHGVSFAPVSHYGTISRDCQLLVCSRSESAIPSRMLRTISRPGAAEHKSLAGLGLGSVWARRCRSCFTAFLPEELHVRTDLMLLDASPGKQINIVVRGDRCALPPPPTSSPRRGNVVERRRPCRGRRAFLRWAARSAGGQSGDCQRSGRPSGSLAENQTRSASSGIPHAPRRRPGPTGLAPALASRFSSRINPAL